MPRNRILIVDDDKGIRFGIRNFLVGRDYEVQEAGTIKEAEELFRSARPDVALIDYALPDGTALELLPRLKATDPGVPVIVLTGQGSIDLAVKAIKEGAEQFLTKPVQLPALLVIIERVLETQRLKNRDQVMSSRASRNMPDPFIGESDDIRALRDHVERIASTDRPVLIHGETGTGKGVLAAWLHAHGERSDEAFVDLNCAGLSKDFFETELFGHEKGAFTSAVNAKAGLLEVAHRGVLFLDEVGDVDVQVQPKLLKVLEEKRFRRLGEVKDRTVDIQLIAATHQDLNLAIREKRFRSDLYYRISTIPISLPPLRQRPADIPMLARYFLEASSQELGFGKIPELSAGAGEALKKYRWPGNIRELRNVIERALLLSDRKVLTAKDLRFEAEIGADEDATSDLTLEEMEKFHIERVLRAEKGQVESASRRLGIPRSSLYQKIKRFGIAVSKG